MIKIIKDSLPIIFFSISIIILINVALIILDKKNNNDKIIEKEIIVEKNYITLDKFDKLNKKVLKLENEFINLKKENNKLTNMVIYFLEENKKDITIEEISDDEPGKTVSWPPSFKIKFTAPSKK